MRSLFAALTVALIALLAAPPAMAGSMTQSLLPRTARGPSPMMRCVEAPISLAFDVVAVESARFADPRSLTSYELRDQRPLRTPAVSARGSVRLGTARALALNPRTVRLRVTLKPCSQAPVPVEHGSTTVPQSAPESPHASHAVNDSVGLGPVLASIEPQQLRWLHDNSQTFGSTPIHAGPRAAHAFNPWRPPAA